MQLLDRLLNIEEKYSELTSQKIQKKGYVIYKDRVTPDIPRQNYIYINRNTNFDRIREIVIMEKEKMIKEDRNFVRFIFDPYSPFSGEIPELSNFNYSNIQVLTFDLNNSITDFADKNCFPVIEENRTQLKTLYNKLSDNSILGSIHNSRWIDIKLRDKNIETIVYSEEKNFLGHCELYFNDDIVKFDDFEVLESLKGHGYGDALLRSAISISKSQNASLMYLLTDQYQKLKKHYERRGFKYFAEYYCCTLYR